MTSGSITGIHHITAIASDPQQNLDFYTDVLGLRLVKLTVNFDDPGTYHFYFGNEEGRPGSILTFFPWPGAPRGTVGNGQVSATAFAIPPGSLAYWRDRLVQNALPVDEAGLRFGEPVLRCADPDGLPLELIATSRANPADAWKASSVAPGHAICGFHSATLSEEGYERTSALIDRMGLHPSATEGNRFRYTTAGGGAGGTMVDVVCTPDGRSGRLGAGTVHHIAWRTPDTVQQEAWRRELAGAGYNVTPIIDRTYFRSIYFREPGGILFEIATDSPGFALDEPREHLGERLMLPGQFEPHRAAVQRALPRLTLPHERTASRP